MIIRNCIICNEYFNFRNAPSDVNAGGGKYCSIKCRNQNMSSVLKEEGIKPIKRFVAYGKDHYLWKESGVSYSGLHYWVKRQLGKPLFCVKNKDHEAKRFVWANISGEYKRDLSDWQSLCTSCNKKDGVKIADRFILANRSQHL